MMSYVYITPRVSIQLIAILYVGKLTCHKAVGSRAKPPDPLSSLTLLCHIIGGQ